MLLAAADRVHGAPTLDEIFLEHHEGTGDVADLITPGLVFYRRVQVAPSQPARRPGDCRQGDRNPTTDREAEHDNHESDKRGAQDHELGGPVQRLGDFGLVDLGEDCPTGAHEFHRAIGREHRDASIVGDEFDANLPLQRLADGDRGDRGAQDRRGLGEPGIRTHQKILADDERLGGRAEAGGDVHQRVDALDRHA